MKANRLFALPLFALFFFACKKDISDQDSAIDKTTKEEVKSPKEENGRLVFDSHENFYAFMDDLDGGKVTVNTNFFSLQKVFDKAAQEEDESDISPEIKDLQSFNFPSSFAKVLNSKGEVKIGNEIIWYHSGKKYFISISNEPELENIKLVPEKIAKAYDAGSKLMPVNPEDISAEETNNRVTLAAGGALDARHQREFNQVYPPNGGPRKYVHEIRTYTESYTSNVNSYNIVYRYAKVLLRIKMEWKTSRGKWRPAGETRNVTINVTGNATMKNDGGSGYYTAGPEINQNYSLQVNSDHDVILGIYYVDTYGTGEVQWQLDLWGTIYQHVVGDNVSNGWYNTGTASYPLW